MDWLKWIRWTMSIHVYNFVFRIRRITVLYSIIISYATRKYSFITGSCVHNDNHWYKSRQCKAQTEDVSGMGIGLSTCLFYNWFCNVCHFQWWCNLRLSSFVGVVCLPFQHNGFSDVNILHWGLQNSLILETYMYYIVLF